MGKRIIEPSRVEYVGKGAFLPGLPARSMALDEWESYPEDLRAAGITNGLYRLPVETTPEPEKE